MSCHSEAKYKDAKKDSVAIEKISVEKIVEGILRKNRSSYLGRFLGKLMIV